MGAPIPDPPLPTGFPSAVAEQPEPTPYPDVRAEEERSYKPGPAQAVSDLIESFLGQVRTAMPGVVTAYNSASARASVRPALREKNGDELPIVTEVPVMFPGAGDWRVTFPVVPGDTGLIVFCERDIERWLNRGETQTAGSDRRFDWSDAVFYPGLRDAGQIQSTDPSALVIGHSTGTATITMAFVEGGPANITISGLTRINLGIGASDLIALEPGVRTELAALRDRFLAWGAPPQPPLTHADTIALKSLLVSLFGPTGLLWPGPMAADEVYSR